MMNAASLNMTATSLAVFPNRDIAASDDENVSTPPSGHDTLIAAVTAMLNLRHSKSATTWRSIALDLDGGSVDGRGDGANVLLGEGTARQPKPQREPQVFHRTEDRRRRRAAMCRAPRGDPREQRIDRLTVRRQQRHAGLGNGMQLLAALARTDGYVAQLFEHGQRRIDDARARAIGAGQHLLDRLDDLVAVARLFRDQMQHDETQVAMV